MGETPRRPLMPTTASDSHLWFLAGACRTSGLPPDSWFPQVIRDQDQQARDAQAAAAKAAKAACAHCPVLTRCRSEALASPHLQGIWGGQDERERRKQRREDHQHA